jgi:hypothetical protein
MFVAEADTAESNPIPAVEPDATVQEATTEPVLFTVYPYLPFP